MAKHGAGGGKIFNCCYCGVESSFLPGASGQGTGLSALICGTCGAPLASQKARPLAPGKGARLPASSPGSPPVARPGPKKTKGSKTKYPSQKTRKLKKPKKRKGLFQVLLSEAADFVEDIFD